MTHGCGASTANWPTLRAVWGPETQGDGGWSRGEIPTGNILVKVFALHSLRVQLKPITISFSYFWPAVKGLPPQLLAETSACTSLGARRSGVQHPCEHRNLASEPGLASALEPDSERVQRMLKHGAGAGSVLQQFFTVVQALRADCLERYCLSLLRGCSERCNGLPPPNPSPQCVPRQPNPLVRVKFKARLAAYAVACFDRGCRVPSQSVQGGTHIRLSSGLVWAICGLAKCRLAATAVDGTKGVNWRPGVCPPTPFLPRLLPGNHPNWPWDSTGTFAYIQLPRVAMWRRTGGWGRARTTLPCPCIPFGSVCSVSGVSLHGVRAPVLCADVRGGRTSRAGWGTWRRGLCGRV